MSANPRSNKNAVRLQKLLDLFPKFLGDWEEEHPKWRLEALLWILDRALHSLRHCLESPSESEITWDNPHVELHFPVTCTWGKGSCAEQPSFSLQTGQLSSRELNSVDTAAQALSRLLIRHVEIVALQDWTNHTAFEKRGSELVPVVGLDQHEKLKRIRNSRARAKAFRTLFQPKSFGAGTIDYGDLEEGQTINAETSRQLAAIEPPIISLPITLNEHKLRLVNILEVHPLVADPKAKKAYFPIVVGLALQPEEGDAVTVEQWQERPWLRLSNWEEKDRRTLWEWLHQFIETALEELGPKATPEIEEAILTVNARIKVTVPKGDVMAKQLAIATAISGLQTAGEIVELKVTGAGCHLPAPGLIKELSALVARVEAADGSDEKGRSLEALVAALFRSVSGFEVLERVRTETEEIDLWIGNHVETSPFRREGDVILAECKNWGGKCGKNEFGSLLLKMMNRGGRCTLGFLVSWNGFADTLTKEMLRGSKDAPLIVPLAGEALVEAARSGDFYQTLVTARERALII